MDVIRLTADDGWASGPVVVADTFRLRWRGLRPGGSAHGMLFRTRSVHGFGMDVSLGLAAIDPSHRVIATGVLHPRRVAWFARAVWVLELPDGVGLPTPGSKVESLPRPPR